MLSVNIRYSITLPNWNSFDSFTLRHIFFVCVSVARVAALETQLRDAGIEPQDSPDISTESTTTTTSNKTPNVNSTMENRPAVSLDLSRYEVDECTYTNTAVATVVR